jgi:two-component system response regulator BaeR
MKMAHILVVEDELKIAQLLQDYLIQAGYSVSCLSRGDTVDEFVKRKSPDLILLDLMLPGKDGIEICRDVRKFSSVPIVMITARVEEVDRLLGLEMGADDYICKPFSPREAVARVKAVLRRSQSVPTVNMMIVGPIMLDCNSHFVEINGQQVNLTPSEFKLLEVMMSKPDRVFSRTDLVNRVQGYEFDGYERTIDSHIKNLRRKIDGLLPDKDIIVTVYGVGYKLIAEPD